MSPHIKTSLKTSQDDLTDDLPHQVHVDVLMYSNETLARRSRPGPRRGLLGYCGARAGVGPPSSMPIPMRNTRARCASSLHMHLMATYRTLPTIVTARYRQAKVHSECRFKLHASTHLTVAIESQPFLALHYESRPPLPLRDSCYEDCAAQW